jgi:hypothetical protein
MPCMFSYKVVRYCGPILTKLGICQEIFSKTLIINFIKVYAVVITLKHVDKRMDTTSYDFVQFILCLESAK